MKIPQQPRPLNGPRIVSLAALGLGVIAHTASAANVTWVGNTSNLWNVGSNWSTSAIPANGDTLIFGAAGSSGTAVSDDIASLTVGGLNTDGISFGASASNYTISRPATQVLTLGSSGTGIGINHNAFNLQTISSALVLGSTQTINVAEAPAALTISGGISGSTFGLTKTGAGLLTLSASNTFTGPVTLSAGTVATSNIAVGVGSGLGATASTLVFDGGSLRYTGSTTTTAKTFSINTGKTATIDVSTAANTLTMSGAAASTTGGLTKTGAGTLALSGTHLYTGDTSINQGTLSLTVSNAISSSSKLVLGGQSTALHNAGNVNSGLSTATLSVTGAASTSSTQTFNGVTLKQGNNAIVATSGTGGSMTLALGTITPNAGGAVNFTLPASGAITVSNANVNGILGGWATVGGSAWATNSSGNVAALTTGYTTIASGTAIASDATTNVAITTAASGISTMAASGTTDINTLQLNGNNAYTLNIGTGNILRLGAQGGILFSGTTAQTIGTNTATGGTLTAGGADNTDGQIVIHAANLPAINSAIKDNGTGKVTLVINSTSGGGGQTLNLNASASNYSGGTYINSGKVLATNVNAFGTGDVNVLYSGGAILSAAGTFNNNFNVGGIGPGLSNFTGAVGFNAAATLGGTLTLLNDTRISTAAAGIISGKITGNYGVEFTQTTNGNAGGSVTLSNTGNDFTGGLAIHTGITAASTLFNTGAIIVKIGASEVITNGAGKGNVTIFSGTTTGTGTLDLNSFNETINGLVSGTGTSLNGTGSTPHAFVTNNAAGTGTATLSLGDGNATATFAGVIKNGTTAKVAITKIGSGTQTFGGVNTYTGNTTITGGTLALSSTGSISNSAVISVGSGATFNTSAVTSYTVASGQTLRGAGSVTGAVLAGSGATVAAGVDADTIGTLTFSSSLDVTAATVSLKLNSSTGVADLLAVNSLTLGNATLVLSDIGSGAWSGASTFTIANVATGTVTGSFLGLAEGATVNVGSNEFTISYVGGTGNDVTLTFSSVPEPSTYAAILGTLVLAGTVLRRRRSVRN